jgi:hypothetical protein
MIQPASASVEFQFSLFSSVVLWPAFLMASVCTGVIFSLIDPAEMQMLVERFMLSSQAIYTLGFLLFWLFGCVASGITALLLMKTR